MNAPRKIALLGSTGSIGQSTLEVVDQHPDKLQVYALAAGSSVDRLEAQVKKYKPERVVLTDPKAALELEQRIGRPVESGEEALVSLAADPALDCVVSAVVGARGLKATLAAVSAGTDVALANKESIVVGGELVTSSAQDHGARILPVDSEHSAIFQCLQSGQPTEVEKIILTASGGPFYGKSRADLEKVSVEDALNHPTWVMGPKITIDSATLFNKALELIEACFLFGVSEDQVDIVVHRQSIVHSLVQFCDGSVMAQMGLPDMKLPIQLALSWPDRWSSDYPRMNLPELSQLSFANPDSQAFPAIALVRQVMRQGGTAPAIFNAANEVAVERFLNKEIPFLGISQIVEDCLQSVPVQKADDLDVILESDRRSRESARACLINC